jgi:hypothetical protein
MKTLSKLVLIISLFSILFSCQNQKSEIHYIGLYTTTITSLNCENLKKATHKKNLNLSGQQNEELLKMFSELKPVTKDVNIDVRLYGFIFNKEYKRLDFCMNIGFIEINNKKYFVSEKLKEYILKITKT